MHCALYDAGRCRSCQWLERPVPQQLADKMARSAHAAGGDPGRSLGAEAGQQAGGGFRNKAKMVGSAAALSPLLRGCCTAMALRWTSPTARSIPPSLPGFATLKPFIARAGLTPYNVARKRGELNTCC